MKKALPWALALLLTLALSFWQRVSGPTYALRGTTHIGGAEVAWRLDRSFAGPGDAPIQIPAASPGLQAQLSFRPTRSEAPWTTVEMAREGALLTANLPHQPVAGKLDYKVMLREGSEIVWLNGGKPATIRFRGAVPAFVLVPHILAMFASFLFAARAGLAAAQGENSRPYALATIVLMFIGGLVLGPIVQKYAFGEYWTGWPIGPDLTDNKTAVAWLFWLLPLWRRHRGWTLLAAAVTFVVFAIPHSWLSGNIVR